MGISAEGAVVSDAESRRPAIRSSATCAVFDPLIPFETWSELGFELARYANGSCWWLGDWLLFGREKYGRRYRVAAEEAGLDAQTLRNYATVARRIEPHRRREALSFQHHAEVCALSAEEQDGWLDLAQRERWSRNELRRRLRASQRESDLAERVSLQAPPQGLDRWRRAAEREALGLEEWIIRTLNDAAVAVLETRERTADIPTQAVSG